MPYTSIDLIRNHINFEGIPIGGKRDYPVIFSGTQWNSLPNKNLLAGSVAVKARGSEEPIGKSIVLGNEPVALTSGKIAVGSVAAASDSSLGTIYTENIDYAIDPANATIMRITGGNIAEGTQIAVWYRPYIVYEEGVDYSVNYAEGEVRRLAGGAIQDNQAVLVDYEATAGVMGDVIFMQAVSEANSIIESEIDSERSFGADQALQTAATYLAVSIVCRMAVSGALMLASGVRMAPSGQSWLALAESYRGDYERLIKPYRPHAARLSGPART
ncbi:conserved hypothetical protein [Candidatus Zixiibacteriota bacterium]|nr:conserved hypothetical protein [candidate division Zixibacteria bacterium]